MRFIMSGLYDRAAKAGPITGWGPNFDRDMAKFTERQRQLGKTGRWRKAPATWKKDDGTRQDSEWYIYEY